MNLTEKAGNFAPYCSLLKVSLLLLFKNFFLLGTQGSTVILRYSVRTKLSEENHL